MSSTTEPMVLAETGDDGRAEAARESVRADAAVTAAFSSRGFTSLLLTIVFVVLGFSGVMLYLTPRGRLANWSDWQLLGLAKDEWVRLHVNISILFLVVAVLHLVLNWSIFWGYLRRRAVQGVAMRKELFAAAVVSAVFVAGPIFDYPPFRSIMLLNYQIKDYWERTDTSGSNSALADTPDIPAGTATTAAVTGSQEVQSGSGMHAGAGTPGEHFGRGGGMGWGRRMGGGLGLGPGRGAGRGLAVEQESASADTAASEGN